MAQFIIRIQFHPANEADYETLYAAMNKEDFTITKKHRPNQNYSLLSTEEYKRKGNTLKDINDAVFRVARKTGKQYSFTVMKECKN